MKQLRKTSLYIALLLMVSVSCERKDPCDSGSCCGPVPQKLVLVQSLDNAKADVGNQGLIIEGIGFAVFCKYQEEQENIVKLKRTYSDGKPQPFYCRVWGKVFECVNCPTYIVGRVLYVQVDKIEMVD